MPSGVGTLLALILTGDKNILKLFSCTYFFESRIKTIFYLQFEFFYKRNLFFSIEVANLISPDLCWKPRNKS